MVDGEPRIASDPPLIERIEGPRGRPMKRKRWRRRLHALLREYRQSLQTDRRVLLEEFRMVDIARKVVGVGGFVGTRAGSC